MTQAPTVFEFLNRFPDDDTCLDHLMQLRHGNPLDCPKCGKNGKYHRIRKEPAYQCAWCGHHIHPMVGTPFHRSHVPLQKWFYAMYLFTTTRHGVPAKELQRQLGVSYPTALRMGHKIRQYMGLVDGDPPLTGHVEADETFIGGRKRGIRHRGSKGKTIVFGILERGGEVYTKVIPNRKSKTVIPEIYWNVPRGTPISTDNMAGYKPLAGLGYPHKTVNHDVEEWARGDTHVNSIEGFWSILKRSIQGTHVHVSRKQLPKYLGEFEFRYNLRKTPELMVARLLAALAT